MSDDDKQRRARRRRRKRLGQKTEPKGTPDPGGSSGAEELEFHAELAKQELAFEYDPNVDVDADEWLALDEDERSLAVMQYHVRHDEPWGESLDHHAMFHGVVENQLAEGYEPSIDAVARLRDGGLDRHSAVHAVASVVAKNVFRAVQGSEAEPADAIEEELRELTADSWMAQFQGHDE